LSKFYELEKRYFAINKHLCDVCVCVVPGFFREMETFLFQNRRDILNTTLLARITAHEKTTSISSIKVNIYVA